MLLIASVLLFPGFYLLYITSSRVVVSDNLPLRKRMAESRLATRLGGFIFQFAALTMLLVIYGVAAGIFLFISLLSVTASVTSLFLPFLKIPMR